MIDKRMGIRLYPALCFKILVALFCCASQAQSLQTPSLIGSNAIKSFKEDLSTEIVLQVGNGACATVVTKVQTAKNGLLVSMVKPKNCKFKYLELTMGQDVFPLAGLGEEFEATGEQYRWRASAQVGNLFFAKNENQTVSQLNALRIREPLCKEGSCLSSAMVLVVTTPANVVSAPQASSNASSVKLELTPTIASIAQARPALTCADNADGTFTSKQGTVWQKCVVGQSWQNGSCIGERKTVNWYEAVIEAKYDRFLGHKDWVIPTEQLIRSTLIDDGCNSHPSIKKRDAESVKGYWWTSTPGKNMGQAEIMSENTGGGTAYVDHHVRNKNDWNGQPTGIGVTLVRLPPPSDTANIINSSKLAETEIAKRLQQPR